MTQVRKAVIPAAGLGTRFLPATKALAKELAPSNVQVNAIACGVIDTSMNDQLTSEERKALEEEIPAGRYGTPKEIAQMVWNIVHAPEYMTGQIIGVDGGFL